MLDCWRWCWLPWPCSTAAPEDPRAAKKAEVTQDAIKSLKAAEEAWGRREDPWCWCWPPWQVDLRGGRKALGGDALRKARRLLERSCAKSAAKALIAIDDVAKSCDTDASAFVKAAERAVRDVVVMRCQSQDDPEDRFAFLDNLEKAFGGPLDTELQGMLSVAFFKIVRKQRQRWPQRP